MHYFTFWNSRGVWTPDPPPCWIHPWSLYIFKVIRQRSMSKLDILINDIWKHPTLNCEHFKIIKILYLVVLFGSENKKWLSVVQLILWCKISLKILLLFFIFNGNVLLILVSQSYKTWPICLLVVKHHSFIHTFKDS